MPTCKFLLAWLYTSEPNPDGLVHFLFKMLKLRQKKKGILVLFDLLHAKLAFLANVIFALLLLKLN